MAKTKEKTMFLRPTNDFAFKKLFGNHRHTDIVVSFVNTILEGYKIAPVVDVELLDKEQLDYGIEGKTGVVDVRCRDQDGRTFIVEMQVANDYHFAKRILFYWSRAFGSMLKKNEYYDKLEAVYVIAITNFEVFKEEPCVNSHRISSINTGSSQFPWLGISLVELPRFQKSLDELESLSDRWVYFLKSIHCHDDLPTQLSESVFNEASDLLREMALTKSEHDLYERVEMHNQIAEVTLRYSVEMSRQEGRQEGRSEALLGTIRNMLVLNKEPLEIAKLLGISSEELQMLMKTL